MHSIKNDSTTMTEQCACVNISMKMNNKCYIQFLTLWSKCWFEHLKEITRINCKVIKVNTKRRKKLMHNVNFYPIHMWKSNRIQLLLCTSPYKKSEMCDVCVCSLYTFFCICIDDVKWNDRPYESYGHNQTSVLFFLLFWCENSTINRSVESKILRS